MILLLAVLASASAFADPVPASTTYQSPIGEMQRNLSIGPFQNETADVTIYIASPDASDPFQMEGQAKFTSDSSGEPTGVLENDGCQAKIVLKKDNQGQYSSAEVTGNNQCFLPMGLILGGTYNISSIPSIRK